MKSKLSAMKYVRNNKKQVGIIMIALTLSFMTMYVIHFLCLTTSESFKVLFLEQPKKVAYIDLSPESMGVYDEKYDTEKQYVDAVEKAREKIIAKLKKKTGITDVFYTQVASVRYQGIVGEIGWDFPLVEKDKIKSFVEHMDAELIAGKMPTKDGEILVDKKIFKNQKMKMNEYMNEEIWGKTFKIVGILDSKNMTCVGIPQGFTNSGWYIVILCNQKNADMKSLLLEIGVSTTEYDKIIDIKESKADYQKSVTDIIDVALNVIVLVILIFLTIAVLVTYISFLRNRENEYCLYTSIGFSREEVYAMIMREVFFIFGSSIFLGVIISILVMVILGKGVIEPMGLQYTYYYPQHLLKLFAAFVAMIGILQIPIVITIYKIKQIDRIEE